MCKCADTSLSLATCLEIKPLVSSHGLLMTDTLVELPLKTASLSMSESQTESVTDGDYVMMSFGVKNYHCHFQ